MKNRRVACREDDTRHHCGEGDVSRTRDRPSAPEVGWAGEEGRRAAGERLALVVGTRDELVPADAVDEQLAVIGPVAERARVVRYDGGHRIDAETLKRLADD